MTVRSVVEQMNPSGIDANESITHRSSGPLRQISARRYGLAILSVGVALGASLLLDPFHFRVPSALLLLFAVAISSWYAGAGPAVLAAILSTISFYWYFVEPVRTIYISRSQIPYFVIFTAFAALLSRFGTFRQRAEADLRRTHDQLKVERPKLGSRTIALLYFIYRPLGAWARVIQCIPSEGFRGQGNSIHFLEHPPHVRAGGKGFAPAPLRCNRLLATRGDRSGRGLVGRR